MELKKIPNTHPLQRTMRFLLTHLNRQLRNILQTKIYFGKHPQTVPLNSIVFFPINDTMLCCGIAGIVAVKKRKEKDAPVEFSQLSDALDKIEAGTFKSVGSQNRPLGETYLGGKNQVDTLWHAIQTLKNGNNFCRIFTNRAARQEIERMAERTATLVACEDAFLADQMGRLPADDVDVMSLTIDRLKDTAWCLRSEILNNVAKVEDLISTLAEGQSDNIIVLYKNINAVMNSIDRMEVRGRDSAGISLLFVLSATEAAVFEKSIKSSGLLDRYHERIAQAPLVNKCISTHKTTGESGDHRVAFALTYKVALEIGSLGDNISFLRHQVKNDRILQTLVAFPSVFQTVSAHTRWASVGAITEANCHPVDNITTNHPEQTGPIIHTCLNGDIDNYQELKREFEQNGAGIHTDITTDTKIIPLQIEKYIQLGHPVKEAFRLALNDFAGSHAISMHTDLAPGKLFLGQRGSGQAIFVGLAVEHYMPTSEVYGFIEETQKFIKLDGESLSEGRNGMTQGQIFVLDQNSAGGLDGITASYYDGTPIELGPKDIKQTELTSRDIDRQDFPHYFLKEISESPLSVEKTLQNRWKISPADENRHVVSLGKSVIPDSLQQALTDGTIKRVYFIGQGTAGVAAQGCANILDYYLHNPACHVAALKASEMSGFNLQEGDHAESMADALVVAISQSGTTTDTNRTIDMVKERGGWTMAIVNRRDSDITFKVDGVLYTSSGRDIEMSVASTKAFYAQIIAGALLGLFIAKQQSRRDAVFISNEIQQLLQLPGHMRKVLNLTESIKHAAEELAVTKTYWAAVGSGPNKTSADEIRIKLSELCYKTISSDYVEDKKHIDLSSEPLIIVCAAGTRSTVIGDIIKDTAIFKAHKATPIVIADEGEHRFDAYAEAVFHVPTITEHLAPILNTLVGHLWGYYAALSINAGSRFLYGFQEDLQNVINQHIEQGVDIYELVLEKNFREKIAEYENRFRKLRAAKKFPVTTGFDATSDLILLMKYLSGRLPVSDFELDFGRKGTAANILDTLFGSLAKSIGRLARPVDAIKHQAKTVTVGTSRISERMEGVLFDALATENMNISQLTPSNVIVLKNLQSIVAGFDGSILYRISGLSVLGETGEDTAIAVLKKRGQLAALTSRVETDQTLQGTKLIIVRQGNVYTGIGRKDDRSILVIPLLSSSVSNSNVIEYLLLLHINFKENPPLDHRIKALGGKHEHIKNIVQENSLEWEDAHLDLVAIDELFGRSAEKIGEFIVAQMTKKV